jgi:hypothetical protein
MRIHQDEVKELVEDYSPIKTYNHCMIEPIYRIGEGYTLAYDYDKFVKSLEKKKKISSLEAYKYIKENFDISNISFIKFYPSKDCNRDNISLIDSKMLFCEGLDNGLVGCRVSFDENNKDIAVYDLRKCVDCLVDDGMTDSEAMEYLDYNTLGSYVGEYTPCFIHNI